MDKKYKIGIIGLGYVGLPLSLEFGKLYETVGFDKNTKRVIQLNQGNDINLESSQDNFKDAKNLTFSSEDKDLDNCNIYIVTVPTPIDRKSRPNFEPLVSASEIVGSKLKKDDIVIYESTVYPGATEEVCVPVLEASSDLVFNKDFYCGYSPERVNPGDKKHRLTNITKITSGSTPATSKKVDQLYKSIIEAGTYLVSNLKIAEAAKVIENIQRDVNIALINELSQIFNELDIDSKEVFEAAETKWNFMPFRPGLVGGHCIGVDPYYLTHKAKEIGYDPKMILAGRRINNGMGEYVSNKVLDLMISKKIDPIDSKVLLLGLSFKEDCPDLRNTRVIDILNFLKDKGCIVEVHDPWVNPQEAEKEYNLQLVNLNKKNFYDVIIVTTAHKVFRDMQVRDLLNLSKKNSILYDVKSIFPADMTDGRL